MRDSLPHRVRSVRLVLFLSAVLALAIPSDSRSRQVQPVTEALPLFGFRS